MGCSFSAARQAKKDSEREEKALKSRPEKRSSQENVLFEKPRGPAWDKDDGTGALPPSEVPWGKGGEKKDSTENIAEDAPVLFDLGGNFLESDQTGFLEEQEKKAESEMLVLANQLESEATDFSKTTGATLNEGVEGLSEGVARLKSGTEGAVSEGAVRLKMASNSAVATGTEFVSVELEAASDRAKAFAEEGKEYLSTDVSDIQTKAGDLADQAKEDMSTKVVLVRDDAESLISESKEKLSSQAAATKDEIEAKAQSIVSESTELALSKVKAAQVQAGNFVQEGQEKVSNEASELKSDAENVLNEGQTQISTQVTTAKESMEASANEGAERVASQMDSVKSFAESTIEQGQDKLSEKAQSADETFETLMSEGGQSISKLTSGAKTMVSEGQDKLEAKTSAAEVSASAVIGQTGEQFSNVEDFVSNVISQSVQQVSTETKDTAKEATDISSETITETQSTGGNLLSQGSDFVSAQAGEVCEKVEDLVNQGKEYVSEGLGKAGQAVGSAASQGVGNIFIFDDATVDEANTEDAEGSTTTEEFSKQIVDSVLAGAMETLKGTTSPDEGTSVDDAGTSVDATSPGSSVDTALGQGQQFVQTPCDKVLSDISEQDSLGASLISFGASDGQANELSGRSSDGFDSSYSSGLSRELCSASIDGHASLCSTMPSDAGTVTPDAIDLSSPETSAGLPSSVRDEIGRQVEPVVQALSSDASSFTDVSSSLPDPFEFDNCNEMSNVSVESSDPGLLAGSLESSLVSTLPTEDDEWRRVAIGKMDEMSEFGAEHTSELVKDVAQGLSQNLPPVLVDDKFPGESSAETTPTGLCGTPFGCPRDPGYMDHVLETGHDPAVHGAKLEDRFHNNDGFKKSSVDPSNPRQQDAALSIQTQYRQHAAKEEVAKMQQEMATPAAANKKQEEEEVDIDLNDPEVADAAIKIQAGFRGYKARKEVHDIKRKKVSAAVRIQAGIRGHLTRRKLKSLKERRRRLKRGLPRHIDPNDENVNRAAAKIQALVRGHKARQTVKDLKVRASHAQYGIDPDNPLVHMAASKIQALVRGHKARRRVRELQNLMPPPDPRRGNHNHINCYTNNRRLIRRNQNNRQQHSQRGHRQEQHHTGHHHQHHAEHHHHPDQQQAQDVVQIQHVQDDPHIAATKIQALVRGHKARKEVKVMKVKKTTPVGEPAIMWQEKPGAHEAATKIQAIIRGRKARKDVKVLRVKHKENRKTKVTKDGEAVVPQKTQRTTAKPTPADNGEVTSQSMHITQDHIITATTTKPVDTMPKKVPLTNGWDRDGIKAPQPPPVEIDPEIADIDLGDKDLQAVTSKMQSMFRKRKFGFKKVKEEPTPVETVEKKETVVEPAEKTDTLDPELADIDLNDPELANAATKIQAGFRGHIARKDIQINKEAQVKQEEPVDQSEEPLGQSEEPLDKSEQPLDQSEEVKDDVEYDLDDAEVNKAATKIQSNFRGYRVRKEMNVNKEAQNKQEALLDQSAEIKEDFVNDFEVEEKGDDEITETTTDQSAAGEFDLNDPELNVAATKIQAGFRGHKTRKEIQTKQRETVSQSTAEEVDLDLNDPELNVAATKIQAGFRGHKTRKEMQTKRQEKNSQSAAEEIDLDDPELNVAATKIQAGFRGHKTRKEMQTKRQEKNNHSAAEEIDLDDPELNIAATKIQAGFRGHKTRKEMQTKRQEKNSQSAAEEIDLDDPELNVAATKIQAGFRGHKTRQELKSKKESEKVDQSTEEKIDFDLNDPELNVAATKIQAGFRGHKARQDLKTKQAETADAEKPSGEVTEGQDEGKTKSTEEEEIDIDLNDPEVENAAIKIQAGFKGYKARKDMKSSKEDGEQAAEGADPPSKIGEEEEVDIDLDDPETEKAALKIQAGFRGYKTRKDMKQGDSGESPEKEEAGDKPAGDAEEIDIDLNDPEVEKAATKIQASFKGYKTRKGMKVEGSGSEKEDSPPAEEAKTGEEGEEEIDIDLDDPEVAAAATKIQASFRGHKARQDLKGSKTDISEEKPAEEAGDTKEEEPTEGDGDQS